MSSTHPPLFPCSPTTCRCPPSLPECTRLHPKLCYLTFHAQTSPAVYNQFFPRTASVTKQISAPPGVSFPTASFPRGFLNERATCSCDLPDGFPPEVIGTRSQLSLLVHLQTGEVIRGTQSYRISGGGTTAVQDKA